MARTKQRKRRSEASARKSARKSARQAPRVPESELGSSEDSDSAVEEDELSDMEFDGLSECKSDFEDGSDCKALEEKRKLLFKEISSALGGPSEEKCGTFASCEAITDLPQELIACKVRAAEAALQPWLSAVIDGEFDAYPSKLAIPLAHRYTEDKFSFGELKGDDRIILEVLKKCRDKNGNQLLDVYRCIVTRNRSAHTCSEETIKIRLWVGEEDKLAMAFGKLVVDSREIVLTEEHEAFYEMPGKEIREECYHRAMLISWPKELSISLFCETKVAFALDVLECTFKITDPDFCKHFLRILRRCENDAARFCKKEYFEVTPRLLQLCARASELEGVCQYVLRMMAKTYPSRHVRSYEKQKVSTFQIGIRSAKVAKGVAAVLQVHGWNVLSSSLVELVKQCALSQGSYFARVAKELYLIGVENIGNIVAGSTMEVFMERRKELEQHQRPVFTWCQPQANLPSHTAIQNFLKGPEERYVCKHFQTYEDAKKFQEKHFPILELMKEGYSAVATISSSRNQGNPQSLLEIRKTRKPFEMAMQRWVGSRQELSILATEMRRLVSRIQRARQAVNGDVTASAGGRRDRKRLHQN